MRKAHVIPQSYYMGINQFKPHLGLEATSVHIFALTYVTWYELDHTRGAQFSQTKLKKKSKSQDASN